MKRSDRYRAYLPLLAGGLARKDIAKKLGVPEATVQHDLWMIQRDPDARNEKFTIVWRDGITTGATVTGRGNAVAKYHEIIAQMTLIIVNDDNEDVTGELLAEDDQDDDDDEDQGETT